MHMTTKKTAYELAHNVLSRFHNDESGVAMTEYIIIFSLISLGATVSLISTAVYVKGYRDFLVWWLAHPAV
jgi:Flp pilus assembly pilin Flp